MPVAINVGEVHPHRRVGHRPHHLRAGLAEPAGAIVEPEPVRRLEVVADVNVDVTIAVDVAHLHAQAEVQRLGKRLAIGTDESIGAPRHALKHALPVVEIKGIRLAKLDQPPVNDLQPLGVLAGHHRLAAHLPHRERPAIAQQRQLAEVGHVQVKIAIAIHVAKR